MANLQGTYKGRPGHPRDCDCESCMEEYAEHFRGILLADRLAARDPERAGAVPATDAEWREHMDAEFPIVKPTEPWTEDQIAYFEACQEADFYGRNTIMHDHLEELKRRAFGND